MASISTSSTLLVRADAGVNPFTATSLAMLTYLPSYDVLSDRLIIMAFPAAGVATMWRNDRRVVRRFLDERHGDCWRVYNFCPRGENEYDGDEFYGRGKCLTTFCSPQVVFAV